MGVLDETASLSGFSVIGSTRNDNATTATATAAATAAATTAATISTATTTATAAASTASASATTASTSSTSTSGVRLSFTGHEYGEAQARSKSNVSTQRHLLHRLVIA